MVGKHENKKKLGRIRGISVLAGEVEAIKYPLKEKHALEEEVKTLQIHMGGVLEDKILFQML